MKHRKTMVYTYKKCTEDILYITISKKIHQRRKSFAHERDI